MMDRKDSLTVMKGRKDSLTVKDRKDSLTVMKDRNCLLYTSPSPRDFG